MRSNTSPSSGIAPKLIGLGALILIITLLLWSAIDEWRFSNDRIGVYVSETDAGIVIDAVEPDLPADQAGLQAGDRVLTMEGQEVASLQQLDELFERHHRPGRALSARVDRDGRDVDITLTPGVPMNLGGLLAQLVLVAAYLGLAILAARYRHADFRARLLTIFVTLVAVEMALPDGQSFSETTTAAILLFWLLGTGIQLSLELHLVSLIPRRLPLLQRRRWIVPVYYVVGIGAGFGLAALAVQEWFFSSGEAETSLLVIAESTVLVTWAVSVAAILGWQVWRAPAGRATNQALLVLAGLLPWAIYILVATIWPGWLLLDSPLTQLIEDIVLLIFPASVFLAIFRYGLFDADSLVRRGLVYGTVALLVMIMLYALLTMALPWFESLLGPDASHWIVTGIALLIGILFRPIRHGIERLVERGLYPKRRALRHRLIRAAASLSVHSDLDALIQQLAGNTRESLNLQWAAVVVVDSTGQALHSTFSEGIDGESREHLVDLLDLRSGAFAQLEHLRRPLTVNRLHRRDPAAAEALSGAGAEVLVPLFFQRRMIGILCLGNKQNGELFRREEIELLDLFSHQVATSLENLRLFQDATYEELTGLLRREAVLRQLEAEATRAVRKSTPLSVFMIDLDHFKAVNDAHGHLFGDRILARVAQAMRERIRAVDALGRYGGEEFLLVLPETDLEGALKLGEELRQAVADLKFEPPDGSATVRVTVSIGVASAGAGQQDALRLAADLLGRADAAVFRAKTGGRDRVVDHQAD